MAEKLRDRMLRDSVWRTLLLAIIVLVAGQWVLVWQYQRLESRRIEGLEQRVEQQQQMMEERAAREALRIFLEARIAGDEIGAGRSITERAALQRQQALFEFLGVRDYNVQGKEWLNEERVRFQVEITREQLRQIELIEVVKIGESYYVDSVQPAG
ncbi:MAG: hypothetical protein A2940_02450 [Candidatus Wildermuthbacteria bacterium RIFCSPLOWO2_01_FULL_48_29]|uniref:Uncharacterized protein n=2 Tax=Candidatus Wildermuthiibacteriota TaxID=1817923 RepID=A0A1G2RL23_9BACT|nr:MAG: hypothetical protein A2843_00565 [Candidatus Wildermuthbacteria bacterium RIFCSPHIGHO2_01_FULL_48_27b]OHA73544.1 MAG: hypothetical protein A2940_02450 [Candidatus Wildermuthbacteria bacterium RIFCSPLOWO2_01_FULL_48_29]